MTISKKVVDLVRERAKYRCEYCHYPEFLSISPLTIDHIFPRSLERKYKSKQEDQPWIIITKKRNN